MATSQGISVFATRLSAQTGLSRKVIITWALLENGPDDNPLNIGPGKHFGSPTAAADATAQLLKYGTARSQYGGYQDILAARGNDFQALRALAKSPWDTGTNKTAADVARYWSALVRVYSGQFGGTSAPPDTSIGAFIGSETSGDAGANLGAGYAHIAKATGLDAIVGFLGKLFERSTWYRIFEVIGGAVCLVIAIRILSSEIGVKVPK